MSKDAKEEPVLESVPIDNDESDNSEMGLEDHEGLCYEFFNLFSLSRLFLLSLLSSCFCYLFVIFYDPEFLLFLLSFIDNGYADTV